MTPPIATPKVCPKERKKEYIAPAKGRSALDAEAWTAKDCAEDRTPPPIPTMRVSKIHWGVVVVSFRRISKLSPRVKRTQPTH
jgi:hypothetical protein